MSNSKECEAEIDQTINTEVGFVTSLVKCQLCEIGRVGFVDRDTDQEAIESNNETVNSFKRNVCPKVTGTFVTGRYKGPF